MTKPAGPPDIGVRLLQNRRGATPSGGVVIAEREKPRAATVKL
jgi:hypothetical protein